MSVYFQFKKINDQATINQAKQFFREDIPKLERAAGKPVTQVLSSNGVISSSGTNYANNAQEQLLVNGVDATRELTIVATALSDCSKENQTLLKGKYIDELTYYQLSNLTGYGKTWISEHLRFALLDFAARYAGYGRDIQVYA